MKRYPAIFTAILAALLLSGCFSPAKSAQKAIAKTAAIQAQATHTDDALTDKGKALVYGTGVALAAATPTPAVTLASDLNRQAGAVLGPPAFSDGALMTRVVGNSLSGDPAKEVAAAKELADFGAKVTALQGKVDLLQAQLEKSEVAKNTLLLKDSALAQTWVSLKHWVWWVAGFLLFVFLLPKILRWASLLVPALGPLAGPASSMIARMVEHVVDRVPGVATKAGVVVREVYDATEAAASRSVAVLESLKSNPAVGAVVKQELKQAPGAVPAVEQELIRLRAGAPSPA